MAVSTLLLSAALVAGCGSTSSVAAGNDAGSDAGTTPDAATAIGMIVRGTSLPCTEPHSICLNARFPASMMVQPKKLQIDFYDKTPPTHPPDGVPLSIVLPDIRPGETVQLRMTDVGLTGDYYFLGLVFMPGGGDFFPLAGVDYTSFSSKAFPITAAPMNLTETQDFQFLM